MFRKVAGGLIVVVILVVVWATFIRDGSDPVSKKAEDKQEPKGQITASMPTLDILGIDPQFASFKTYAESSGVAETISADGPYTLFIPSSAAFDGLDSAALKELTDDPSGRLAETLKRHVVRGLLRNADLVALDGTSLETLAGTQLPVTLTDGIVTVGGVKLAKTDIDAKDSEIHVLDSVIPAPG